MGKINELNRKIRDALSNSPENLAEAMTNLSTDSHILQLVEEILNNPKEMESVEVINNARHISELLDDGVKLPENKFQVAQNVNGMKRYYEQGDAGSCITWALVNTLFSLGFTINPKALVMTLAAGLNGANINTFNAENLVNEKDTFREDILDNEFIKKNKVQDLGYPEAVEAQATEIKEIIDNGGTIFLAVVSASFYKDIEFNEIGGHAICINGYQVRRNNKMYLHAIDSNLGEIWIPIELIALGAISSQRVFYKRD